MIARLAAATAAVLLLVACGGDGGRYDAGVQATRDAIQAGDRDAALASLDELSADALRAFAEGDVSEEELAEVTALVEQARTQVDDELPEPTTTTTPPTTAAPTTTPAPVLDVDDDDDRGEDDEKPGEKGKGRGDDDGGDDDD